MVWNDIVSRLHGHNPLAIAGVAAVCALWIFLPTFVAALRRHRSLRLIALINLVFFWEFWIWMPLMAWALMDRPGDALVARLNAFRHGIRNLFSRRQSP